MSDCACLNACVCEPRNPPWMHNHVTYCPFYTWSDKARGLAFVNHHRHPRTPDLGTTEPKAKD